MAEPDMIYKMTVLELLQRAGFPMSGTQITEFFTERNYTDYFSIQEIIHGLEENRFISGEKNHTQILYSITEEGKKTLVLFQDRITPAIREDIADYFEKKGLQMQSENDITAIYDRAEGGGYSVHLSVSQGPRVLIALTLNVATKAEADAICYNWRAKYEDVYASLMDILVQ
ncbi:MAG: DUF4364 family protein [Lachnospiraceae bacterium]|jgi:DNA-binding PadR family transcriptional regulator|nr:DUF4364 family protein [Lachnospiraceae bacterium]